MLPVRSASAGDKRRPRSIARWASASRSSSNNRVRRDEMILLTRRRSRSALRPSRRESYGREGASRRALGQPSFPSAGHFDGGPSAGQLDPPDAFAIQSADLVEESQ